MLALIPLSETFYLVVPKHIFYSASRPRPPFISPPKTPHEVILAQGFNVWFYGTLQSHDFAVLAFIVQPLQHLANEEVHEKLKQTNKQTNKQANKHKNTHSITN